MSSSTEAARIPVTAEQPYEVLVGYGLLAEVPALLSSGVQRVALLHPPTMIKTAERLSHELSAAGLEPVRVDLPDGEAAQPVGGHRAVGEERRRRRTMLVDSRQRWFYPIRCGDWPRWWRHD